MIPIWPLIHNQEFSAEEQRLPARANTFGKPRGRSPHPGRGIFLRFGSFIDHGFRGDAPGVDAGAPEQVPFRRGHGHAGFGQMHRQSRTGLACADDDRVVLSHKNPRVA